MVRCHLVTLHVTLNEGTLLRLVQMNPLLVNSQAPFCLRLLTNPLLTSSESFTMVILPIMIYNNKFGSDKVRDSYSFKRFRRIVLLKLKDAFSRRTERQPSKLSIRISFRHKGATNCIRSPAPATSIASIKSIMKGSFKPASSLSSSCNL